MGALIQSPVSLAISTYRLLGQTSVPGVPDFNAATGALGQRLLAPPTVAGWAQGRAWVTPGLLLERGNFARDVLFPDINFLPPDRYNSALDISQVARRIRDGADITTATSQAQGVVVAEANKAADRDEDFNTRYASYRGWQMAIQRVKATPRDTARLDLSAMVRQKQLRTTAQTVDYLLARFVRVAARARGAGAAHPVPRRRPRHVRHHGRRYLYGRLPEDGHPPHHVPARIPAELRDDDQQPDIPHGLTRRSLIRAGAAAGLVASPLMFAPAALGQTPGAAGSRILVVLELTGGNDGLNTVIPYGDDAYYRHRPKIGIRKDRVRKLDDHFGLSEGMTGFERLYKDGKLAIVHGCGYADPSFSHFTSMAYWQTAAPNSGEQYGWIGRLADQMAPSAPANFLINIGATQSLAVRAHKHVPVVFDNPENFTREMFFEEGAVLRAPPGTDAGANAAQRYLLDIARSANDASTPGAQGVGELPVAGGLTASPTWACAASRR
ncbi:MAG: DUF1800 family protein [Caulobacteraceae bacterium]